jgi:hypothetical protein
MATTIRFCTLTLPLEIDANWWDVSSDNEERMMEYATTDNDPPKFPKLPDHLTKKLAEDGWPKPWVREEDRKY